MGGDGHESEKFIADSDMIGFLCVLEIGILAYGAAVGGVFYGVMAAYYMLFAVLMERFYMGESRRLNELLRELKAEKGEISPTGKEEEEECMPLKPGD